MFKKLSVVLALFFTLTAGVYAENTTYLIDVPTYSVLDYGSFDVQFRMFSNGGVLSKLNFGIFKSLNLGVSWELNNIIGIGAITVAVPALQLKFNLYSGDEKIPGFAIGYDGQGFFYDKDEADFRQKGKGVYIVGGKEIIFPSLNLNIGLNINDFKKVGLLGFVGLSYTIIEESLTAMTEFDNIGDGKYSRFNVGMRFLITENLDLDFIVRNILADEEEYGCDRIFKISYQTKF